MQAQFVLERTAGPRRRRLPFRLLTVLDLLGLATTVSVLAFLLPEPEGDTLYTTLAVVGFGTWLLTAQVRTLSTILAHSRNHPLMAPTMTVLVVAVMALATGWALPTIVAVAFAVAWTVWMLASRLVRSRYLSPTRILTIGSDDILAEVRDLPTVSISVADSPPDDFEGFDVVALDPAAKHSDEWLHWLLHADMAGLKLIAAPLIIETLTQQLPLEALHGKWARFLLAAHRPYVDLDWKRMTDVLIVVLLAPVWLPVLGIVLLAVYLDDGGPVIYWQVRAGRYKKPFRMAKVRSMRIDAEADGPAFAGEHDPRVTRVGRFIRRYRLDELPQFWNVLKGDMSVIGPRPEQPAFSEQFERLFPLYGLRYDLRPGITGWAQVRQGYAADPSENYGKLRHDLYYVRHVSPLLDAWIALKTLAVLLSGYGAR